MQELKIIKSTTLKDKPEQVGDFGTIFTDHMFVLDYEEGKGWHNPVIEPYQPMLVDPASAILHYGQGIFEGMKAYKTNDGLVQLFRPRDNFLRLNRSAERLCIPQIDVDFVLECLNKLIELESEWIPTKEGTSLYIRPYIVATESFLGVRPSHKYKLFIILSPVGAYYPEGLKPVKILVEDKFVRAVAGGLGEAKTMANYAASLLAAQEAKSKGFSQVLWLDGVNLKYVEEVGTMNIFFKINGEIITPALNGSILPGITRDSVIKVLKSWGLTVNERKISIDEVVEAFDNELLEEAFGTGTAAVISPVGILQYKDKKMELKDFESDSIAHKLYDFITKLQYGKENDTFDWIKSLS
ncbi:branched chain amino acid aminotransferase apoenzyme [Desulfonispora thiosulfatigenes DSM 11270]|uniref:Branched-chain-amino-acid aminotransferase n=1 Tax=Desulfonispora thiosulfatigenes DSM 11270 TaxID=656914 RepID=A0A1W1VNY6_DESTI|nr:branched-chain amino acid aminotransferase [Desulfonispora thiosulfatigenes]SMB95036.1 branched chain amino acid aminotransferase apoenzyme [Desulfonispora thiosulfatigenes DSM 11270]